jgi:hypothetical protein
MIGTVTGQLSRKTSDDPIALAMQRVRNEAFAPNGAEIDPVLLR